MIYALYGGGAILILLSLATFKGMGKTTVLSVVISIAMLIGGIACVTVAHDKDLSMERNYVVTDVIATNNDGTIYRVSIKEVDGTMSKWIYVPGTKIDSFKKDSTITMSKKELSLYEE